MSTPEENLKAAGIELPAVSAPAASYVPYRIENNVVYVSGQLPIINGEVAAEGHLGSGVAVEDGKAAASVCALNILSHLRNACEGELSRVSAVLKLEILVASAPNFTEPHVVANGASDIILKAFGDDIGAHARVAYGVATLPMGVAVEVAGTFAIR